ncbi:hypothetical protein [Coleofasciculus sp.]|uniref:hypothetical protein n=1 Tax=Coleofasciculus sp. TaxID=3100458 RepID=UPI003A42D6EF
MKIWAITQYTRTIPQLPNLTLVEGWYEPTDYRGSDRIHSPLFLNLALTSQQVLNGNVKN